MLTKSGSVRASDRAPRVTREEALTLRQFVERERAKERAAEDERQRLKKLERERREREQRAAEEERQRGLAAEAERDRVRRGASVLSAPKRMISFED